MDCSRFFGVLYPNNDTTIHTYTSTNYMTVLRGVKFGRFRKREREQYSINEMGFSPFRLQNYIKYLE